jgi:hypothetical protein
MAVSWWSKTKAKVKAWFGSPEDLIIIEFFGPLMQQVKSAALKVGQDNLVIGLAILKEAAIAAVLEAQAAGDDKIKVAERTFIKIVKEKGITAMDNATAGLIKAAVAILQNALTTATKPLTKEDVAALMSNLSSPQ